MSTININKGLIGEEDISAGSGSFSRRTSTGTSQTLSKLNLRSFNNNIYNVQDYIGGAPDGTSSNTVAIQEAIDACELTGGTIYFPGSANAYRAIGLTVNEPITICGDGRMSHINSNGDGSMFTFNEGVFINLETQNGGPTVRDLYLTGNSRLDNACALTLHHLDHANFNGLWIEEFLGTNEAGLNGAAITFADSIRESRFTDVYTRYCGTYNSKFVFDISNGGPTALDPSNNNLFTRCSFVYYYGDAVVIKDPGNASGRIRGHKFLNCLWHGVLDTVPVHVPTANDKLARCLVITESEGNVVKDCTFSTTPADNPCIWIKDTRLGQAGSVRLTCSIIGNNFGQHHTSTALKKWGVYVVDGDVEIRQNTFILQDPAWESEAAATISRDDTNVFVSPQLANRIIEATGSAPTVQHGQGADQVLDDYFTVMTKNTAGDLTRRMSIWGGSDTGEIKFVGSSVRSGSTAPSHTTDAGGAALSTVSLYIRNVGGQDESQPLHITADGGTTWRTVPAQPRTGAVTPVSNVTPVFVGEIYVDTVLDKAWISVGTAITDWEALTP